MPRRHCFERSACHVLNGRSLSCIAVVVPEKGYRNVSALNDTATFPTTSNPLGRHSFEASRVARPSSRDYERNSVSANEATAELDQLV
jgi:hypothetical protein